MVFLDGTALNIALPVLQAEFRATIPEVQWIVAAYALFLAALMLVGGSLGDYLGRRRVYGLGVGIFAFASLLCGLSQDVTQLVVARAAQGIGGALLVPASLALINATFPAAERGRAIGTWSAFSAVPALAGPLLGGWLIEVLSWRWIFFINLPRVACVLAVLVLRVPAVPGERGPARLVGRPVGEPRARRHRVCPDPRCRRRFWRADRARNPGRGRPRPRAASGSFCS